MATVIVTRGNTIPDSAAKTDFHNLIDQATGSISGLVNVDVSGSAAIASSKLDLSSVTQNIVMNGKILKTAQGANVASAASMTLGDDGNLFFVTGTTTITSITAKAAGTFVVIKFTGVTTLTDGSNLVLNGNFLTAADYVIALISDGTNWIEVSRQPFAAPTPVTLSDTATIATDAATGNYFRVTIAGNRTLGNPTNAVDGQKILWEVIQDGTGGRTLAFGTKFVTPTDLGTITLTGTASKRAIIGVVYNSSADKFYIAGFLQEF